MADKWVPSEMPVVEGEIVSINQASSEYGPFQTIELRTATGTNYSVAAFHAVLKRQVEEAGLEPGDTIRVEYLGKGTSKKGREFNNYDLTRL